MRGTIVLVCAVAGALGGIGCLLAGLFELQGFGTPQDSEPRVGYLLALSAGLGISVATPLAAWRLLLPDRAPAWPLIVAMMAATALLAVAVLGFAR